MTNDVDAPATIGMDEPAQQQVRPSGDNPVLPLREDYSSLVLATGGVLWEQTPKLLRVSADFETSRLMHRLNVLAVVRQNLAHGCDALIDDPGIARIEGNSEPENTTFELGQAAVT